ncbi:MAG: virulence RhuM family protein [Tannerella sp.]|nr:virulence RhuM family protein [Tannerella sp.]
MTAEVAKTKNEIILYQPDSAISLEVLIENESVWLSLNQMTALFQRDKSVISRHIRNIFEEEELIADSVVANFATTAADGKTYLVTYYNLDVIISVGYRVKSKQGTKFRQWATPVLRDYALRGYVINQRLTQIDDRLFQHEQRLLNAEKQIDFIVRTEIPPKEGVFYDGQIFDAFVFVADLIRTAKKRIVLIDNYLDDSVLILLAKRKAKVTATIYTKAITPDIQIDLTRHNAQYPEIFIEAKPNIHDRFLVIDNAVYHIGASFKDLGKKLFAFSKMEMTASELLKNI